MYSIQKLITVFILIFIGVSASGQDLKNDHVNETALKIKIIKMPKYPIADFPKKSIAVSDIQVLQFVRDSVKLGYVLKGIANQVAQIQTEKPLTIFLQHHIEKMYKNDFKSEGSKILWVIKELRISERINFTEYSYLKFKADSYISSDNKTYSLVCKLDTVFVTESVGDVIAWHGQELEDAMKLLLKESLKKAKDLIKRSDGFTLEEISKMSKPQINYPILVDSVYLEGAYKNFEEFIKNKPSINNYKAQTFYDGKSKFIIGFIDDKEKNINIWGVSKNGEIYKFIEKQLVPIEKSTNGFIVSHYILNANKRNRSLLLGGLLGGVAGGLIGGIAGSLISLSTSVKMLSVKSIPYITKPNKQPNASLIDMETGELSF